MSTAMARLAQQLAATVSQPWTLMEVCGGQTHAIVRSGLDQLLPPGLRLIHGPGCPVCVTPAATIDAALELATRPGLTLCSYGDMLRVPGSDPAGGDLLQQRAAGGDVRLLTSPLQALAIAQAHPQRQVVFLAVGFETTAPATALLARQALALKISNLSLLLAHVRVPPAMEAIITAPGNQVQGFLAAGHVCSVMGISELELLVHHHQLPVVVTGFEPLELMQGLLHCVQLLEAGTPRVLNAYKRVVRDGGNPTAQALVEQVFELAPQTWRGLGALPASGLALRPPYHQLDARRRFQLGPASKGESDNPCISGLILQGQKNPVDCPAFGKGCRPEHPLGAPMVSSEGACAAYHHYRP
ncbi:MAG: protein required for maturation of hydrogenase [Cyanobacteriota bacterium]|jgi:hydrogenase expression/formation protein HypD